MRGIAWILVCAGCDTVFGLSRPVPPACPPPPAKACSTSDPDEDQDGVRDACDLCPALPSTSTPDTDRDGVGDPCDPQPTTPAACRSRFFYGLATGDGLIASPGWVFDGYGAYAGGELATVRSVEAHLTGRVTAQIDDGEARGSSDQVAGVMILATEDHAFACVIQQAPGGAVGTLLLWELNSGVDTVLAQGKAGDVGVTPGNSHLVSLELTASWELTCRSTGVTGAPIEETLTVTIPPTDPASAGLVERDDAASFKWLDVVPD